MGAAVAARHLGADHAVGPVHMFFNARVRLWRIETRPAASGIELRLALEEWCAAGSAFIDAVIPERLILTGERPLRALFAHNAILLGAEFALPFFVGFGDAWHRWS